LEGLRNFEGGYKATGIIEKLDKRDNASDLYSGEYPVRISAETPTVMIFLLLFPFFWDMTPCQRVIGSRRFGTLAISSLRVKMCEKNEFFVVFMSVYLELGNDHLLRCTLQFIVIHSYAAIKLLVTDSTVNS